MVKLALALIDNALAYLLLVRPGGEPCRTVRKNQQLAQEWFESEEFCCDTTNGISFACACHVLGIDHTCLRKAILTNPRRVKGGMRSPRSMLSKKTLDRMAAKYSSASR